jgi:YbbR domain-containing protein
MMAWHPFRNLGLKATALALGTLLWLTVSGHQVERRIRVPVAYSNIPPSLEMTSEQDDVSVHVRGTDTEVSGFGPGDIRVIVDLGDAGAGTNLMALRPELVEAPLGVEVLSIEPGTVTVTLERSIRKDVPVAPFIDGQPAPGFQVGRISVVPATVPVIGPESRFVRPVSVVTDRIRLDGHRTRVEAEVNVASVDSQVRLAAPQTVRVVVEIVPGRAPE